MWSPAKLNGERPAVEEDFQGESPNAVGLGWFMNKYRGHRRLSHFGDLPGFSFCIHSISRRETGSRRFMVLCNNDVDDDGYDDAPVLARHLADVYVSKLADKTLAEKGSRRSS
jgi:hypothetical protein